MRPNLDLYNEFIAQKLVFRPGVFKGLVVTCAISDSDWMARAVAQEVVPGGGQHHALRDDYVARIAAVLGGGLTEISSERHPESSAHGRASPPEQITAMPARNDPHQAPRTTC